MQFYFLSIVINLLAGVILAGDYLAQRLPGMKTLLPELSSRSSGVTIGAITAGVGVLKLFVLANPLQVAIVGDLLPALAGIALGGVLTAVALNAEQADAGGGAGGGAEGRAHPAGEGSSNVVVADGAADKAVKLAAGYRTPAGRAGIAVALLHFLFPGSLIL